MSRIDALGMIGIFVLLGGILFSGGIMETTPRMRESQSVSIIFFPPIILIQQMPAKIWIVCNSINNPEYIYYYPCVFRLYSEEFINKPSVYD